MKSRYWCFHRRFLIWILLWVLFPAAGAAGVELDSRYCTLIYRDAEQLAAFNKKLYMGRLARIVRARNNVTIADEVSNKLDVIVEKVETVLDMFPQKIKLTVMLFDKPDEVQAAYYRLYQKRVNYIAFYAPGKATLFLCTKKLNLRVIAHETGHAVVDHYFKVIPPVRIHELMAQFAESHILD